MGNFSIWVIGGLFTVVIGLIGIVYTNMVKRADKSEKANENIVAEIHSVLLELKSLKEALPATYLTIPDHRREIDNFSETVTAIINRLERSQKEETNARVDEQRIIYKKLEEISKQQHDILVQLATIKK